MREIFVVLLSNKVLIVSIISWAIAQVIKIIIEILLNGRVSIWRLFGSGGMPSSHSSCFVACAVAIGRYEGFASPLFALSMLFCLVVMYDAINVRHETGKQSRILNYMMENWQDNTPEIFAKQLKELVGHTPFQVFCGAVLGLGVGLIA